MKLIYRQPTDALDPAAQGAWIEQFEISIWSLPYGRLQSRTLGDIKAAGIRNYFSFFKNFCLSLQLSCCRLVAKRRKPSKLGQHFEN